MFPIRSYFAVFILLIAGISCRSDASANTLQSDNQFISLEAGRLDSNYFELPMRISPFLSGNFAELRANHLHSGLDFKTALAIGTPVYAPADGWISRIRVDRYGFGLALYINHPNGFTTVYGHLDRFSDSLANIVRSWQYRNERFELDTTLTADNFSVKKGDLIAHAGNSGLSAAPHLHFEIRDTKTEETIDPLLWYSNRIKDSRPPRIQQVALYSIDNQGVLSNKAKRVVLPVVRNKKGEYVVSGTFPSTWGAVGFGLKAYDYMDGTTNLYGVYHIRLYEGENLLFEQSLDRFNFDQTRYVNALIDFDQKQRSNSWIMKSYLEPNNMLRAYPSFRNRGILTVDSAKTYNLRYELSDRAGNFCTLRFILKGEKRLIPIVKYTGQKMGYWVPNSFVRPDCKINLPVGALYKDLDFKYEQRPTKGFSDTYRIHDRFTPLHLPMDAAFRIQHDSLPNKQQYILAKLDELNRPTRMEATYRNGWMTAQLKDFGNYTVMCDTIPPKITPSGLENVAKNNVIRIRITDERSGIQAWTGLVDGRWMLFELDGKTGWLTLHLDKSPVEKGKQHQLEIRVLDACGNEKRLETNFYW